MLVPASFTCCHMDVKSALLSKTMEAWRVPCLYLDYEFVTGGGFIVSLYSWQMKMILWYFQFGRPDNGPSSSRGQDLVVPSPESRVPGTFDSVLSRTNLRHMCYVSLSCVFSLIYVLSEECCCLYFLWFNISLCCFDTTEEGFQTCFLMICM